jgi:hypothetical protein
VCFNFALEAMGTDNASISGHQIKQKNQGALKIFSDDTKQPAADSALFDG